MIPLVDLHPKWVGMLRPDSGEGISFDCPKCGPSHTLCAYFENPLDGQPGAPWQKPTWKRIGDTFELLIIEPSIQYPCFHGWVEYGQVIDVSESTIRALIQTPEGMKLANLSPRQAVMLGIKAL